MKKTKTDANNSQEKVKICVLDDHELNAVTGGLYGGYSDASLLTQDEELDNTQEKGGCGKS